tara:strand:+ start:11795 stop:12121 length:327 start_codon:yes stop_codon:yes gene_type:complete
MSNFLVDEHYREFRNHARERKQYKAYQEFVKCPALVNRLIDDTDEGLSTYYVDIRLDVGVEEAERFREELNKYGADTGEFVEQAKMAERLDSVEGQVALLGDLVEERE